MARKTKNLKQRNSFIILTNGKESEKNYFTLLRGHRKSIFEIKVKFVNADPIGLIKQAIKVKDSTNRVWIVFDKDEFPNEDIYRTIRLAKKDDIGIAFSNIAFEVWLIAHFKEFNLEKNAEELNSTIDSLLKKHGYLKGYEKNDLEVISSIFLPKLDIAMQNANVSLQKRISEYSIIRPNDMNYPYCDWNSCTTVHKLIDALKLETPSEE